MSVNGGGDGGVSTRVRSFPVLGVGGSSGGETGASCVISGLGGSPMIITGADGAAIPTLLAALIDGWLSCLSCR